MPAFVRSLTLGTIGVLALAGCSASKSDDAPASSAASASAPASPSDPVLPEDNCKLELKHTAEKAVQGTFSCGDQTAKIDEGVNDQGVAPIILHDPADRKLLGYATLTSTPDGSYTLVRQNQSTLCQTYVQPQGKVQNTDCNKTSGVRDTSVDSK